jgi:hypothetical protein
MATYYVKPTGSNASAGTSTATAWQTLTFALGATSGFASGDTLWVAAGTYREAVTVGMTSPTATTTIKGDTNGAIFGTAGECRITAFTTNDDSASGASNALTVTSKNFLYWQNLKFEGGTGYGAQVTGTSTNNTFDTCICTTTGSNAGLRLESTTNLTGNHLAKNCVIVARANALQIVGAAPSAGDQNMAITIQNCFVMTSISNCIFLNSTGATGTLSGVTITNCTLFGGTGGILIGTATYRSATASVTVRNCLMLTHTTALAANVSGQMDEDYCRLVSYSTARSLVTAGANSISNGIYGIDFDGGFITGAGKYLFMMPNVANIVSGDGTATGAPSTDIYGYTRPNPPSVGAAESNTLTSGGMMVHPGMAGGMRG